MKTIGIITIHKINNYGSVFQAYALQVLCEEYGYKTEIIDYRFPNSFHQENRYATEIQTSTEPLWIKLIFGVSLLRQHYGISRFVSQYQHLSSVSYENPDELCANAPVYDIYITGSDQVWNPKHCNGDPAFLLHFAPEKALKIAYAPSIGLSSIPKELHKEYKHLLSRYKHVSVREEIGSSIIKEIAGMDAVSVLDPTMLLTYKEWNRIAVPERLIKKKYVLCYFLNYSFDAFPYVDNLTEYIQCVTGYEVIVVARPPHRLRIRHTQYRIGSSPEEFIALVRDAEMVLTTSFHGTAFAINYGKPLFSIVQDRDSDNDNRQVCLLKSLGLEDQILSVKDPMPAENRFTYDVEDVHKKLNILRSRSKEYLINSLKDA